MPINHSVDEIIYKQFLNKYMYVDILSDNLIELEIGSVWNIVVPRLWITKILKKPTFTSGFILFSML